MVEKTSKKVTVPNYSRIYKDLIEKRFPERMHEFVEMLNKENFTFFEIIKLNDLLFGKKNKNQETQEQRYRAYDKQTILRIFRYQKQHMLNDRELALHFKLSKNTIARWKSTFGGYTKFHNF